MRECYLNQPHRRHGTIGNIERSRKWFKRLVASGDMVRLFSYQGTGQRIRLKRSHPGQKRCGISQQLPTGCLSYGSFTWATPDSTGRFRTVHLMASNSSQEPPLKRKRDSQTVPLDTKTISLKDAVRDDKFYLASEDGADCVLYAGGTLFRVRAANLWLCYAGKTDTLSQVHRYHLKKDSSAFRDMFSAGAANNLRGSQEIGSATEGTSDENPIILPDDALHFRALLWALYAL